MRFKRDQVIFHANLMHKCVQEYKVLSHSLNDINTLIVTDANDSKLNVLKENCFLDEKSAKNKLFRLTAQEKHKQFVAKQN